MEASFGYHCPKCNSTAYVTIGESRDDAPLCAACGNPMIPDPTGQAVAAVGARCEACDATYGLVIGATTCSNCGGPLT